MNLVIELCRAGRVKCLKIISEKSFFEMLMARRRGADAEAVNEKSAVTAQILLCEAVEAITCL